MDLPPRFRRHPRYGNVLHRPQFIHHHITPLPPSPPPPMPPHILLSTPPPLLPPRYDGQLPFTSHFSSPTYPPILERSYLYESDPPRKPYLEQYHPQLIPPPHQANLTSRIIHDYPLQDSILENEIFRRGCNNSYIYDFPQTWGRELHRGATEVNSRISHVEHRDRYISSRVSGIEAPDMWEDTNADTRRWDNGNGIIRTREPYFERENDVRRWDFGINGGRELFFDGNIDARRRNDDRIRLAYGSNDGIALQLENRQQEFLETNLGLHRFNGRLGRESSKTEFLRPMKMKRVQKKSALNRNQLGKAHRRRIRGKEILSRSSLRGREKENFECLETITKDNQEIEQSPVDLSISFKSNSLVAKANLMSSNPVSKEEICLSTRTQEIRKINSLADVGSANSGEILTEQMPGFLSGVPCPQIELLEKFNVSESENRNVTAHKANSLGDNFVEKEASKDMHSHGLNNFGSGRRLGCRSKKKRRSRKKILHGTRLQLSEDSGEIVNFGTSINSTSGASKLNTDATLSKENMSRAFVNVLPEAVVLPSLGSIVSEKVDIGSDTNRPSFSDRKMKETSLNIFSASLHLSDDVSTECPGHVGVHTAKGPDCAPQLGTDEVTVHAGGSCLANENIGRHKDFGFEHHDDSVELHLRKLGSIVDLKKNFLDSKDLLTSLSAVRVDNINEQPLQDGLVLFENAFDEVPFKCLTSVEVEDITGLSRHHETNIPNVQEDKHLSEHYKSCTASERENSLCKEVENVVDYGMRSADINSKEFCLDQVTIPEIGGHCSSNSKDARILEAAAVADCSNMSLGPDTRSNFLPADHSGIVAEADISLVKTVNQSYKGAPMLPNKSNWIERNPESRNHLKTGLCIDNSSKIKRKRKRKARGTQMGVSGSNVTEPVDKCSSVDDELASLLATDISFVKEADFPVADDNSEMNFGLKEGPSVDEDFHLDGVGFSGDGSFPGKIKKRKVVSPRLNLSSCFSDDSIGDCLVSDDLKLDQVSLRLAEEDADQREETLSTTHMANTDENENFSIPDVDGTLSYGNNNFHLEDDLAFIRNTLSTCAYGSNDCDAQSGDELVASGFDTPSCMSSPEDLLSHTDFHSESEMIFEGFKTSKVEHVSRYSKTFSLRKSMENATSDRLRTNAKVPPSLPQKPDKMSSSKHKITAAVPNKFSDHLAFNLHTSRKFPSHFAKSRTWHRTDHSTNVAGPMLQPSPLPQSHAPKMPRISPSSYIRKGNSLVRKPSSPSITPAHTLSSLVHPSSPCTDYLQNNQVKVDATCIPRIGQVNTSEGSQSLPLNYTERSLRIASCHSVESFTVPNSLGSGGPAKTLDALKAAVKSFEIPECQTGSVNNLDSQSSLGKENPGKKISYVKRRSNQLVATSDPEDSSTPGLDKSKASLSGGYYKNSKNQLIRVSSESHARKKDSATTSNLHRPGSQTTLPIRFGKRRSSKGFAKTYKLSKVPLVWNLNGAQLPDKSCNSLGPHKVWPYLFPWKRTTYRRSSLPTISQKMLLSSKRGAIYTRSTHGYSLRISKVLSACGHSLKWSKSIERNSKKANEEATRAVAAAEKRKKQEKGAISGLSKSRNHVSRERIFRIGSERYKMDPSRRTLHRITAEEEPSHSVVLQSEKNLKRSYVPKRLIIGNDEYVRIGTGNQLVRDPKKRTRILASEKVRWSLRTARLRLARKRKYCQFYTRFGKCNKSDGKCPYIHDPSKTVVCTKFLNDSCTDSDCKLTHKVIPERMQDCSYFLKGSCSNENCPYRHVNVNPESSICKRFLRGYCADGNEVYIACAGFLIF